MAVTSAQLRRVVADAFASDPLLVWMFPDESLRLDSAAAWLGVFVDAYLASGVVDTVDRDGETIATAVWRRHGESIELPDSPSAWGLLTALQGPERTAEIGRGFSVLRDLMPSEPFDYLQFLAVVPSWQRRGVGSEVLGPGLLRCDVDHRGSYLETTNPENLAFYEGHGFTVRAEVTLEGGGPRLWTMWRNPGSHG